MFRTAWMCAAIFLIAGVAPAADGVYEFSLAASGATGMRWRPVGGGVWNTVPVVGGVAEIGDQPEGPIEIEMLGVSYGVATLDLSSHPLDTGDVSVSIGSLQATSGGMGRTVAINSFSGNTEVFASFANGAGAVFGVDNLAEIVATEATQRMGVWVRAVVGATFLWLLVRRGLRWAKGAFGGDEVPEDWGRHRREADELMRRNEFERDLESRLEGDAEWGGLGRRKELELED